MVALSFLVAFKYYIKQFFVWDHFAGISDDFMENARENLARIVQEDQGGYKD